MREDELKATFLLAEDFENTVRKYYLAEGYRFIKANAVARDKGYDFSVASPKGGGKTLVETKVFRTRVVQRADILRAVANLEHARRDEGADRAVFFMTSAIAIPITDTGGTVVVDVAEFSRMLSQYAELSVELSSIVRTLTPMPASDFDVNAYVTFGDAYLAMREGAAPEKKGQSLAL
ncbi:MAG: restriction endonuclease, partial [Hyphomicrobium sp.]